MYKGPIPTRSVLCSEVRVYLAIDDTCYLCVFYSGVFDGSGMLLQSGRGCEDRDQRERDGGSVEFEGCGGGG